MSSTLRRGHSRVAFALALLLFFSYLSLASPAWSEAPKESASATETVDPSTSDHAPAQAETTLLGKDGGAVGPLKAEEEPSAKIGVEPTDPSLIDKIGSAADPTTIARDVVVSVAKDAIKGTLKGQPVKETLRKAKDKVTRPELYAALAGGRVGSLVAGLVPVPGVGGLAGQMVARLPLTAGAMLGGRTAAGVAGQKVAGRDLDLGDLMTNMDWVEFTATAAASTTGAVLGSTVLPPPWGAILGSWLGTELAIAGVGLYRKAPWQDTWVHGE